MGNKVLSILNNDIVIFIPKFEQDDKVEQFKSGHLNVFS